MHPVLVLVMALTTITSQPALAARKSTSTSVSPEVKAAYQEVKETFGAVPGYFLMYPPEAFAGAWEDFKMVQLNSNSAIPSKYKELISLAVSAQIPCKYCTYFHTKAAKVNGASKQELHEAVAISSLTRKWSTVMYGNQADAKQFRKDISALVEKAKKDAERTRSDRAVDPDQAVALKDKKSVEEDMQRTAGTRIHALLNYPEAGLVGAWKTFKGLEMNPQTAIPGKYKSLISLAVAAQVPCEYCSYADTEFAKLEGARPEEIQEAVALASIVRQWSTFLNGLDYDERTFRKEVDQAFDFMARQSRKALTMANE